jgi:hypothetical protein
MPYDENSKKPKGEDLPKSTICICANCEDRFGSSSGKCAMFCKNCKTRAQREAMNSENEAILAKARKSKK